MRGEDTSQFFASLRLLRIRSEAKAETDDDDIRRAALSLGTAFTVFREMLAWIQGHWPQGQCRGHLGTSLPGYHEGTSTISLQGVQNATLISAWICAPR